MMRKGESTSGCRRRRVNEGENGSEERHIDIILCKVLMCRVLLYSITT